MGRPNLYLIRTHILISNEAMDRMNKLLSPKGRNKFIRRAIDELLDREEDTRIFRLNKRLQKKKGVG